MSNDSLGLKGLWQFIGFLLFLGILVMVLYRRELLDAVQTGIDPFNKKEPPAVLREGDLARITGYELRPYRNDAAMIRVDQFAMAPRPNGTSQLTFTMTNAGGVNAYPYLKVTWNRDGLPSRAETFAPKDYHPSGRFTSMTVKLPTGPGAGESGVTVEPFYGDDN